MLHASIYPFKFLWHDMSSSERNCEQKILEKRPHCKFLEDKDQTLFIIHNSDKLKIFHDL